MYKKILVATDGSNSAKEAYKHALSLAQLTGAEILLVHAALSPADIYGAASPCSIINYNLDFDAIAKETMDSTLGVCDAGGVSVKTIIADGKPARAIVQVAVKENVDLIIMGNHGHGPVSSVFLGSVSLRVIQKAPCPVTIISERPGISAEASISV